MKAVFLNSLISLFFCGQVLACSEAGPRDFKVPTNAETACSKIALKYATDFAKMMIKIESQEKGYEGPTGEFKSDNQTSRLYVAKNRIGNSKLIGFNVGLDTKNKWECNFCVDMTFDDKGNCRIESISKHMCAR